MTRAAPASLTISALRMAMRVGSARALIVSTSVTWRTAALMSLPSPLSADMPAAAGSRASMTASRAPARASRASAIVPCISPAMPLSGLPERMRPSSDFPDSSLLMPHILPDAHACVIIHEDVNSYANENVHADYPAVRHRPSPRGHSECPQQLRTPPQGSRAHCPPATPTPRPPRLPPPR